MLLQLRPENYFPKLLIKGEFIWIFFLQRPLFQLSTFTILPNPQGEMISCNTVDMFISLPLF